MAITAEGIKVNNAIHIHLYWDEDTVHGHFQMAILTVPINIDPAKGLEDKFPLQNSGYVQALC